MPAVRNYSKVYPQFWIGKSGRMLRGHAEAQLVALYLITSPHANMIGVYHCPVAYIAADTGSPIEGALKGLNRLIEAGFCAYDFDADLVWVIEMARFQIGALKINDKQVAGVAREFQSIPDGEIKRGFLKKYAADFHLKYAISTSPIEAPCKPLASPIEARSIEQEQEQEIEQEKEQEQEQGKNAQAQAPASEPPIANSAAPISDQASTPTTAKPATKAKAKPKVAMADDWQPADSTFELLEQHGIDRPFAESCIAEFRLYWQERGDRRPGWEATFLGNVKRQWERRPQPSATHPAAKKTFVAAKNKSSISEWLTAETPDNVIEGTCTHEIH